jgi:hypothetical protein
MNSSPVIGTTCPALYNENYEYHLSGDCTKFCKCILNDEKCIGRVISDPDDQSSQFFSRGKCSIDMDKIKKCPIYGMSTDTFKTILKERHQKELDEKMNFFG